MGHADVLRFMCTSPVKALTTDNSSIGLYNAITVLVLTVPGHCSLLSVQCLAEAVPGEGVFHFAAFSPCLLCVDGGKVPENINGCSPQPYSPQDSPSFAINFWCFGTEEMVCHHY